jgi:membrane-bound serine protease (ClpP class)
MTRRVFLSMFALSLAVAIPAAAARTPQRVEVVQVSGIIDGSVERSVVGTIRAAERERAALVVVEMSSRGVLGRDRVFRLARAIAASKVPVATWVGPPGAVVQNGALLVAFATHVRAIAPGSSIGPVRTLDLRTGEPARSPTGIFRELSAKAAVDKDLAFAATGLADVLTGVNERKLVHLDVAGAEIRYHTLDLFGRVLHAAGQPSIAYLFLLVGLVGLVFEIFHPSTGPAGVSGLVALALAGYGVATLGGSWLGAALMVIGVTGFCVDLRFQSLGLFSAAGFAGLVTGSLLLFPHRYLSVSPWILAFGIAGMVAFLLGAMTRVLRDLRAAARGELEVTQAHPHHGGAADDA